MRAIKVGDRVRIDLVRVSNFCKKKLPDWYSEGYFTINEVMDVKDDHGYPIVKMSNSLGVFNKKNSDGYGRISSYYLVGLIEDRAIKLKKINSISEMYM
jgi:hypothetical protein